MSEAREIDESLRQKAFEAFKTVPYARLIGMELIRLERNEATIRLPMRDELRQPYGLLHGGATASLVDTATAFAVIACLGTSEQAATVNLTIHYLRPHIEGTLTCHAKVVKAGKRLVTVSAEVLNEEEKLVATAISTYSKV